MADLDYDYIIIGAGAAGLLLADALGKDPYFSKMSILILDKDSKKNNDRTWCFWEKGAGCFDDILYKQWNHISFKSQDFCRCYPINPYSYKMVRGIDFYTHYLKKISGYTNIELRREAVDDVEESLAGVVVRTQAGNFNCQKVFDSRFSYDLIKQNGKYPVLQQHFVGWVIKTSKPVFNVEEATYMDFSIPQKGNTRFMYVLPFKDNEALVEYTLFSENLLSKTDYETAIKDYIVEHLQCDEFDILEREQGNIPMTCFDFAKNNTERIVHIGTAGGWAKPSTGYAFLNTSKKIPLLLSQLRSDIYSRTLQSKKRFWFYDLLFLDVLSKNNALGHIIFTSIFKKRKPQLIFKFLNEETNIWEDIYYILGCPTKPFLKAFFKRML